MSHLAPPDHSISSSPAIGWVLRGATAGCFIGHGAFGIITKADWLPYFALVGIPESAAWRLMPAVGVMDIAIGLAALFWPARAVVWWAVGWALWTAALRPLTGQPIWEFFERAGNYGAPLAWLVWAEWRGRWSARLPRIPDRPAGPMLGTVLRWATALLLLGHAGGNLFHAHPTYLQLYQALIPGVGATHQFYIGLCEAGLAIAVIARPTVPLLLGVSAWKLGTELLWPLAGFSWWEFIERFGSLGVPLAYALLLRQLRTQPPGHET
jgi:hypothetical protein